MLKSMQGITTCQCSPSQIEMFLWPWCGNKPAYAYLSDLLTTEHLTCRQQVSNDSRTGERPGRWPEGLNKNKQTCLQTCHKIAVQKQMKRQPHPNHCPYSKKDLDQNKSWLDPTLMVLLSGRLSGHRSHLLSFL